MIETHPDIDAYGEQRRIDGDVLGWSIDSGEKRVAFLVPANHPVGPFPSAIAGYTVHLVPIERPKEEAQALAQLAADARLLAAHGVRLSPARRASLESDLRALAAMREESER